MPGLFLPSSKAQDTREFRFPTRREGEGQYLAWVEHLCCAECFPMNINMRTRLTAGQPVHHIVGPTISQDFIAV